MKIEDWLLIGFMVLWVISLIVLAGFGNRHFKNVRAEKYRQIAVQAAQQWVGFMDRQELSNDEKFNQALNAVVKELTAHGFSIGDQKTEDLKALIEWTVTRLRMEQAKTGVKNTVKPAPEVAKNVKPEDIVQPSQPTSAGVGNGR